MRKSHLAALFFSLGLVAASGASANSLPNFPSADPAQVCNGLDAHDGLAAGHWSGVDESANREGDFYFSGPAKSLPALDDGLRELGFTTRPMEAELGRVARISAPIDNAWLHAMMPRICKLTTKLRVDYDGWQMLDGKAGKQ